MLKGFFMIALSIVFYYLIFSNFNPHSGIFLTMMNTLIFVGGVSIVEEAVNNHNHHQKK
jgi:uncharacterized oligopeptide transporter (OPT) family protein